LNRSERPRPDPAGALNILFIRLRRVGDIIMTTPAVEAVKRALPRAAISYVVEEPFRRLVEGNPRIDRVIAIPAKQGAGDFARFVRQLRRETYDVIVDFHGGPRASRIAWLAKGKFKAGYKLKYKSWIYDVRVPRSAGSGPIHSVENHLNLVRALGIEVEAPPPRLFLAEANPDEKARLDRLWAENGLGGSKAVILHVGAGNEFRDWGERNLAALAGKLAEAPGSRIVLVGAEADRERAERIAAECGKPVESAATAAPIRPADDPIGNAPKIAGGERATVISLAGKINLIELREVIARAALYVGPDSGPMHIAATTRTPIVALFGPTLPANFSPWQAEATIVQKDLACRPCKQRDCVTGDFRCLQTVTVDEVLAAARKYL
jgi:ADP-heptose:LPS heptosyltransferase